MGVFLRTACAAAFCGTFIGCTSPDPEMHTTWTHFRGNPEHTGAAATARPIETPALAWSFDTGGSIESSPAVVRGTVFCGTFADHLFAVDAETGEERWRFRVDGLVRASPAVADGLVFFGADDDRFYALDAATGEKRWSVKLGGGGQQSSPAIVAGVCYFGAFDHQVYAVDASTGELVWKFATEGEILSSPAVAGGLLAIGSRDGNIYGLDAASGEARPSCTSARTITISMHSPAPTAPNSGARICTAASSAAPPS